MIGIRSGPTMKLPVIATLLLSAGIGLCQDNPSRKESGNPAGAEKEAKSHAHRRGGRAG
jgi:hypothetical protein